MVRHGESTANVSLTVVGREAVLTEKGREQAAAIAERCKRLPVEVIVSSGLSRADQTADYIVKAINRPLLQSDLFAEKRGPSGIVGLSREEPAHRDYLLGLWQNFTDPTWRYADAENYADLNERSGKALEYLIELAQQHILVVGHGDFGRILAAKAMLGDDMTAYECLRVARALTMDYTGLSVLIYRPTLGRLPWRIASWNDKAHLA